MKLSELIEETLCQIAVGIKSAAEKSGDRMAIAPATLNGRRVGEISYVEFDVALVVTEEVKNSHSTEKGAGAEIKVMAVGGIGGKGSLKNENEGSASSHFSHRVTFKVPIIMSATYKK